MVNSEVSIDGLEHASDTQVITPVLVENDIATCQSGLRKIIDESFLLDCQLLESIQAISEQLDVDKLLIGIVEIAHQSLIDFLLVNKYRPAVLNTVLFGRDTSKLVERRVERLSVSEPHHVAHLFYPQILVPFIHKD